MLKIVGMILIILSSSAAGFSVSKNYSLRTKGIKSIIASFEILKAEIVFKREDIQRVLKNVVARSTDVSSGFFEKIRANLETEKYDLDKALYNASPMLRQYRLQNEEVFEIENAVKTLGKYDAENQSEILQNSIDRLKGIHEKALLEEQKNSKLFKTVGFAFGVVLSLLLL